MYNVSFKISENKLHSVLAVLQPVVARVNVALAEAAEHQPQARIVVSNKTDKKPKRRYKRAGRSQQSEVRDVLNLIGSAPFPIKELIRQAKARGINEPSVYKTVRDEVLAGHLKKVEPGLYQRTAAGMAQTLSLDGQESQAAQH